jgi:hypothetical protein
MKHIKLFEDYTDQQEKELLADLFDLGYGKTCSLIFIGVIPNGDDFAGSWGIPKRKIQTNCITEDEALVNIKNGKFEVILDNERDDELYYENSLDESKIIEIAKSSSDLEEFWENINQSLLDEGKEAYVEIWGNEISDAGDEDDNNRVNMDAFDEIWMDNNAKPNIITK